MIVLPEAENHTIHLHSSGQNTGIRRTGKIDLVMTVVCIASCEQCGRAV